ncbi:MAG: endonuclease III [Betaproteobacteria bacterium]
MPKRDVARLNRILNRLAEAYPGARCALVHANPFQLLIATILSAQCTDECVNRVTEPLFARYPEPQDFLKLSEEELAALIRECGLNRTKARSILATCRVLVQQHGGLVPASFTALIALPGVGRKTAGVVLANAFGEPYLPVDTHIFRVSRRLGLASGQTPDQVSDELEALISPEQRLTVHHQLIAHGRQVCSARRPRCPACPLASDCPSRNIFSPSQA